MSKKSLKPERDYEKLPRYCLVLLGIAALSLLLYFIAALSPRFAAGFQQGVGGFTRALLGHLTGRLPFSLAELLLFCLPLLVVGVGVYAYRTRCESWKSVGVYLVTLLSVASLLFSLFVFSFGTGYHTPTLDERLGLDAGEISTDELYQTALLLAEQVNAAAEQVSFGEDGFSQMPYDFAELGERLVAAYTPLCAEYSFIQRLTCRPKPVLASRLMSYMHITGVYSYFTGEANVNTHFPAYTTPFTTAHEMAHQRGIARENEANFIAFLACVRSDDPYILYSGYLNLLEYVASALSYADYEKYQTVLSSLCPEVVGELRAYAAFFEQYRDSAAADLSELVNDTYLKLHGNAAGTASYGLVVELAVAYFKS